MAREVVYNGWLFGIDPDKSNRVRFAHPFTKPDRFNYIDVNSGAITELYVVEGTVGDLLVQELIIECGLTTWSLTGGSADTFQLRRNP